jgi:hypothetical protein
MVWMRSTGRLGQNCHPGVGQGYWLCLPLLKIWQLLPKNGRNIVKTKIWPFTHRQVSHGMEKFWKSPKNFKGLEMVLIFVISLKKSGNLRSWKLPSKFFLTVRFSSFRQLRQSLGWFSGKLSCQNHVKLVKNLTDLFHGRRHHCVA